MTIEVKELRSGQRYVFDSPLTASFGSTEVQVVNISAGGLQVLHPLPQRVGSMARVWFRVADMVVSTSGRLIWSHLAKDPETGKTTYRSGLRVEDPDFAQTVQQMVARRLVMLDSDTLEKKKQRLIQKERERSDKHYLKALPTESVPSEQLLLIQHARERLRTNAAEAQRFYERAKTADAAVGVPEDILAVWEYLERTIALATITKVFEGKV
jgi:hypothetical protein